MASTIGAANPFRYKGYYYDTETGLYYLNSRYYNPEWGRFISADSVLGKTGGLLSHNLFVYCCNNPIISIDSTGHDAVVILDTKDLTHMSLLIQNGKKWYYYFYGSNRKELEEISVDNVDTIVGNAKEGKMDDLNEWVHKKTGWKGTYEKSLYLEGDFEKSYEQAKFIVDIPLPVYHPLDYNCMQSSVAILYNTSKINGKDVNYFKGLYYYFLRIPEVAYKEMETNGF